jgi:hypothetical protein
VAVKGCARSPCIVEGDEAADRFRASPTPSLGIQIDFLVLNGSPEALDEDVVSPCAPFVHADQRAKGSMENARVIPTWAEGG